MRVAPEIYELLIWMTVIVVEGLRTYYGVEWLRVDVAKEIVG